MHTILTATVVGVALAAAPLSLAADAPVAYASETTLPVLKVGETVCSMKWGLRKDRGYCGNVTAVTDDKISVSVTEVKSTRIGGQATMCSGRKPLRLLKVGDELTVPSRCLTAKR